MDLDADIDRWRNQSRRPSYSASYRRPSSDAYSPPYEATSRSYFNDTRPTLASSSAARRPPPPPPPPPLMPPPPPAPSVSSRRAKGKEKSSKVAAAKRHPSRHRRRSSSTSSAASSVSRTATTVRAAASTTRSSSSRSSGSTTSSSSGSYDSSEDATSESSSSASSAYSASSSSNTYSSTTTTTTTTASTKKSAHRHQPARSRKPSMSVSLQTALVRVAQRPGSIAQDEEIAAAAACRAILAKEKALKEQELLLLRQKTNFAAEVQRRSSLPHRFSNEDEALRHMQRLVDLEDASPSLEEYLNRTAANPTKNATKAIEDVPVERNATTDADALAYLRTYDPGEVGGCAGSPMAATTPQLPLSAATPPPPADSTKITKKDIINNKDNNKRSNSDQHEASTPPAPTTTAASPVAATAQAAHTRSRTASAPGSHSSLEHSLPAEGHLCDHSGPGTPTQHNTAQGATVERRRNTDSDSDSEKGSDEVVPVMSLDVNNTEEAPAPALAAAPQPASSVTGAKEDKSIEAGDGKAATSPSKTTPAVATSSPSRLEAKTADEHHVGGGTAHVIRIEVPRRRIKVKVRRRRSQSRSLPNAAPSDSDEEDDVEGGDAAERARGQRHHGHTSQHNSTSKTSPHPPSHRERQSSSAPSLPDSSAHTPMVLLPPVLDAPRQLLPPPPSPAMDSASNRQQFAVDPLQAFNPSSASSQREQQQQRQQPWATANWPCGTGQAVRASSSGNTENVKPKDGPPALWYASNSTIPLSQHEFKSLLCSAYTPPEMTYALPPAQEQVANASPTSERQRTAGAKKGKNSLVPALSSAALTPERQPPRSSREVFEPYEDGDDVVEETKKDDKKDDTPRQARAAAAMRRGGGQLLRPRRRSVRVCDPADDNWIEVGEGNVHHVAGAGEGEATAKRGAAAGRGSGRGRGTTHPTPNGQDEGAGDHKDDDDSDNGERVLYASHRLGMSGNDAEEDVDVAPTRRPATPPSPSTPPPPPAPVFAEDGESIVEFPPPPHLLASDMPPPGDVGSDGEDSCCGGGCCTCWGSLFHCLFPCCGCCDGAGDATRTSRSGGERGRRADLQRNTAAVSDASRPLAFQRPALDPLSPAPGGPTQVHQQEPFSGGALRYLPDPSSSPQAQQQQEVEVARQQQPQPVARGQEAVPAPWTATAAAAAAMHQTVQLAEAAAAAAPVPSANTGNGSAVPTPPPQETQGHVGNIIPGTLN